MWPFRKKEIKQDASLIEAQKEALEQVRAQRKQASEEMTQLLDDLLQVKPKKKEQRG